MLYFLESRVYSKWKELGEEKDPQEMNGKVERIFLVKIAELAKHFI